MRNFDHGNCFPLPTLTTSTDQHVVVTFTLPCALVTMRGFTISIGTRTHGMALHAYQDSQLYP